MNGIQLILITGIVVIFFFYYTQFHNAIADLIFLILFSGVAFFFILYPDYSTVIAKKLGVSRGADLMFYCCIQLFLFICIKLFSRIRKLEKKLSELVSELAEKNAEEMQKS